MNGVPNLSLGTGGLGRPSLAGEEGTEGLTLTPSGPVFGPRSIPIPTIIGGAAGVIIPAAVGPRRAIPTPTLAGPISLLGPVLGPRHVGIPVIGLGLTITPSGPVFGPRNIPTGAKVANTIVISPSGPVLGPRAVPSPKVEGSPQYISAFPTLGPRNVPFPAVTGGAAVGLQLFIGGSDQTTLLSFTANACKIESQTIGRWQCTFDLESAAGITGYIPQIGESVLMLDNGRRVFAGCLSQVILDRRIYTLNQMAIHCTATDKSAICDRRVVTGVTFPSGSDIYGVIWNINTNYLNGEGISLQGVPNDGSLGELESDLVCNFNTVTNAFDGISQQSGTIWWVDVNGVLYFRSLTFLPPAPFSLSEISNNWRAAQGQYGLTVTNTTTDYYNKLYAVSNLPIVPGSQGGSPATPGLTQTFTFVLNGPGIYQPQGFAAGIVLSTPAGSITSLTVNGVAQTVVDFGAYSGQVPNPPDLLWFWAGPATGVPGAIVSPSVLPNPGDVIVVNYNPALSTSSSTAQYGTALSPVNPSGDPLGHCGSGVFEGVLQVQNITSVDDLNAVAAAELARIGGVPTIVAFETDFPGLQPGQLLTVDVPLSGVTSNSLLITQVSGVFIPPTLANGGSFRWQIECRNNLDPGNWAKWYERLIVRTANPLPILQTEVASFILPAGSSLTSGQSFGNPYIVQRTGQLISLLAAAATPQTGQDLILAVFRNGSPIAQLRFPNGTVANQLVVFDVPAANNLWIFSRDILTCTATYSIISGSTSKASGLSFTVTWGTGGTGNQN